MPQAVPTVTPLAAFVLIGLMAWIVSTWVGVLLRFAFRQPLLPPNTPRVVPWGAGSVLVAVVVWFGTTTLASVGYSLANPAKVAKAKAAGGQPPAVDIMVLTALYNGATLILIPLTLAATAGARRRDFGLVGPGLRRQATWGIFAYPVLFPCVYGMMLLAITIWKPDVHPLQEAIRGRPSLGLAAIMILSGVVLAPAAEELIFRGVLLGWLSRVALRPLPADRGMIAPDPGPFESPSTDLVIPEDDPWKPPLFPDLRVESDPDRWGDVTPVGAEATGRPVPLFLANVAVSLIFAGLHGSVWPTPIPIFFLSMGLGLLYQRTGGLVAPIALHMTFNGISTLLMFLNAGADAPGVPRAPAPLPVPAVVAPTPARGGLRVDNRGRLEETLDRADVGR